MRTRICHLFFGWLLLVSQPGSAQPAAEVKPLLGFDEQIQVTAATLDRFSAQLDRAVALMISVTPK